jgi:hypothetical protein
MRVFLFNDYSINGMKDKSKTPKQPSFIVTTDPKEPELVATSLESADDPDTSVTTVYKPTVKPKSNPAVSYQETLIELVQRLVVAVEHLVERKRQRLD